jgi:hypothetical protein
MKMPAQHRVNVNPPSDQFLIWKPGLLADIPIAKPASTFAE